jgi:hypothetical protein
MDFCSYEPVVKKLGRQRFKVHSLLPLWVGFFTGHPPGAMRYTQTKEISLVSPYVTRVFGWAVSRTHKYESRFAHEHVLYLATV